MIISWFLCASRRCRQLHGAFVVIAGDCRMTSSSKYLRDVIGLFDLVFPLCGLAWTSRYLPWWELFAVAPHRQKRNAKHLCGTTKCQFESFSLQRSGPTVTYKSHSLEPHEISTLVLCVHSTTSQWLPHSTHKMSTSTLPTPQRLSAIYKPERMNTMAGLECASRRSSSS